MTAIALSLSLSTKAYTWRADGLNDTLEKLVVHKKLVKRFAVLPLHGQEEQRAEAR